MALDPKKVLALSSCFTSLSRITDATWAGVLWNLGNQLRLSVNNKGTTYHVQVAEIVDGRLTFQTVYRCKSKSSLLRKYGESERFCALCEDLPEEPKNAFPELVAAWQAIVDAYDQNDFQHEKYGRVVVDLQFCRVVVDPAGEKYQFQTRFYRLDRPVWPEINWARYPLRCATVAPSLSELLENVLAKSEDWAKMPKLRSIDWQELFEELQLSLSEWPELAQKTEWPELPERPETVRQARKRQEEKRRKNEAQK